MRKFIVKVQVPLFTTEDTSYALVYNEKRTVFAEVPVTKDLKKKMRGEFKLFFYAYKDKAGNIVLDQPAQWQDW